MLLFARVPSVPPAVAAVAEAHTRIWMVLRRPRWAHARTNEMMKSGAGTRLHQPAAGCLFHFPSIVALLPFVLIESEKRPLFPAGSPQLRRSATLPGPNVQRVCLRAVIYIRSRRRTWRLLTIPTAWAGRRTRPSSPRSGIESSRVFDYGGSSLSAVAHAVVEHGVQGGQAGDDDAAWVAAQSVNNGCEPTARADDRSGAGVVSAGRVRQHVHGCLVPRKNRLGPPGARRAAEGRRGEARTSGRRRTC